MKILVAYFILATSIAQAANQCETKLLGVINEAQNVVSKHFEKGENCHTAAMIGRSQGKPGCFVPEALELKKILAPIFKKADGVCQSTCMKEGKFKGCKALVDQNVLIQVGLKGVAKKIKNESIVTDASFFEEEEEDFFYFEI
jgi:hypothetical protein